LIPPPEISLVCSLGNGLESNIANPLFTLTLASGVELASEAARLTFFGASPEVVLDDCCDNVDEERSMEPAPGTLERANPAGFNAGLSVGTISRANSRTRTAPSPPSVLSFSTTPSNPYFWTSIARLGCTSHTVRRIRRRLSRTTDLLFCPRRSIIRLKNADDFVRPIVTGVDSRIILSNGSSRFSKELALHETKHLRSESMDSCLTSSSSTRAVSSCRQERIDSRALTWKYGSSMSLMYIVRPSTTTIGSSSRHLRGRRGWVMRIA